MTLPVLAAWHRDSALPITPRSRLGLVHHEWEWAARYAEIERLYINERRKLRYVMQYMEREYGFKATEQMYKKSYAAIEDDAPMHEAPPTRETRLDLDAHLSTLGLDDSLKLMLLISVRTWGVSFFESVQSVDGFLASSKDRKHPLDQPQVNLTFKLVIYQLNRGAGKVAGRIARKAFLLLEDLMMLEAPAIVWNLFEMMHYMVAQGQMHLFQMVLAHLVALAEKKMPDAHPLTTMLRSLRGFVASMISLASIPSSPSSSVSSSSLSSLSISDGATTTVDNYFLVRTLPSMLEQAWSLIAKMLFDHFDPELIELYCQLCCDSCSIELPKIVADAAVHLLSQIETRQSPSVTAMPFLADGSLVNSPLEEQKMLRRLLTPRRDASPPQNYEMLRSSSIAALYDHGCLILSNGVGSLHTSTNIDILAALLTAKILEWQPAIMETPSRAKGETVKVPRIYAGHVACALKALMALHIHTGSGEPQVPPDIIEQIRTLVALREYAYGEADPFVVREMWLLEDELVAAGEPGEAQDVGRDAYRRLEMYLQKIPVDSV